MSRKILLSVFLLTVYTFATTSAINAQSDYRVGWETSMKKIFIKGDRGGFQGSFNFPAIISLSRNEYESFQIVIIPHKDLKGVKITTTDLDDGGRHKISAGNVSISPVGYVEIKQEYLKPGQPQDIIGWWPDPILEFMDEIDIKRNEIQPFWVRIYAPKGTPAGIYSGKLRIQADNSQSQEVDIRVNVWDFTLPDEPSLPTAITFNIYQSLRDIYGFSREQQNSPEFRALRRKFYRFLLDYKIDPDDLYGGAPDIDILAELAQTRWIKKINLGYIEARGYSSEFEFQQALDDFINHLKQSRIPDFRRLGLLKYAYIYCFDEHIGHPWVKGALERLEQEFPDIPIMATGEFLQWGDIYPEVDIWVKWFPSNLNEWFRSTQEARKNGKEVWWYISSGNTKPNWFLNSKLIETRLMMGVINTKLKPDGFLYYFLNRWVFGLSKHKQRPITSGPYTNWIPSMQESGGERVFGDGNLFHPGPDGPIPSIRLENFRDGMEDYEYYVLLEKLVREKEGTADPQLIDRAKEALNVNPEVFQDFSHYTEDPQVLYREREKIANLIIELLDGESQPGDALPPSPPKGVKVKLN